LIVNITDNIEIQRKDNHKLLYPTIILRKW
jgi:hypothetical protein